MGGSRPGRGLGCQWHAVASLEGGGVLGFARQRTFLGRPLLSLVDVASKQQEGVAFATRAAYKSEGEEWLIQQGRVPCQTKLFALLQGGYWQHGYC